MQLFHNDYNKICHNAVWAKMEQASAEQVPGYGLDPHCENAARLIRKACDTENIDVHFLVGGTQTNLTLIAAALRPHQGVLSAESGHISEHETGAIEASGHKVLVLPSFEGKVKAADVQDYMNTFLESPTIEFLVQPKLLYISNPTEYGTTYNLAELTELSKVCHNNGLYLYVDGARLGYGLAAADNDISLSDYARLCDAFYIGGTKCGTMFGEALVISAPALREDFRFIIKQRGGLMSKGWLLGIQFEALFENDLYRAICVKADELADEIRATLVRLGFELRFPSHTNQVFAVLPKTFLDELGKDFTYSVWQDAGPDHYLVRFCTSWATKPEDVRALCTAMELLIK